MTDKVKRLYTIGPKAGSTHRGLNEEGKSVVYGYGQDRDGTAYVGEIMLTDKGAEQLKHLDLRLKGERRATEISTGDRNPAGGGEDDGLDKLNKAQLIEIADKEKVAIEGDANKATIIEAIRADRAAKAEAGQQ